MTWFSLITPAPASHISPKTDSCKQISLVYSLIFLLNHISIFYLEYKNSLNL